MRRFVGYADLISGTYITFNNDSQICPRSQGFGKLAREQRIVHPNSKPARHPRFGYLKDRAPDLPPLSDQRIVHRDPFRGYVFAKLTEWKRSGEFLFPPTQVLDRVSVESFIGPAVDLTIA
jgi:hypothetical protein